jgi:hypothetical protein
MTVMQLKLMCPSSRAMLLLLVGALSHCNPASPFEIESYLEDSNVNYLKTTLLCSSPQRTLDMHTGQNPASWISLTGLGNCDTSGAPISNLLQVTKSGTIMVKNIIYTGTPEHKFMLYEVKNNLQLIFESMGNKTEMNPKSLGNIEAGEQVLLSHIGFDLSFSWGPYNSNNSRFEITSLSNNHWFITIDSLPSDAHTFHTELELYLVTPCQAGLWEQCD